jgi:hypothetical protein
MMTQPQRRAITFTVLAIIAGVTLAATETHRHLLAAVWPSITAFFDYLTY